MIFAHFRTPGASVLLAGALGLAGCSSDAKDATGGKRVTLGTRVQSAPHLADEFTTGTKWRVTLESAQLAIGGLYYFDGKPAFASLTRRSPLKRLGDFFIGTAHAHPQHYVAGSAVGEMTEPSSVDLFQGARLADGDGVTGTFRSGRLVFPEETVGPAAANLEGHVAAASGVATKDDRTVRFVVSVDLSDIQEISPRAEVDGCVFDETDVMADGTVTMTVTPSVWFNLVDFAAVETSEDDSPTELVRGELAHKGFVLGVAQLSAYHFHYEP